MIPVKVESFKLRHTLTKPGESDLLKLNISIYTAFMIADELIINDDVLSIVLFGPHKQFSAFARFANYKTYSNIFYVEDRAGVVGFRFRLPLTATHQRY